MADENSEVDDLDEISSINVELESAETLSTVSSSPSQIFDLGLNAEKTPLAPHVVHLLFRRERGLEAQKSLLSFPLKTFPLTRIFPKKVLRAQVFMGMSRCGRFLMTYSTHYCVPSDEEWYGCVYKYQLHWWIFPPDGIAVEVGNIPLFGNARVPGPLQIYICQWPVNNDKVLVYGLMRESVSVEAGGVPANQRAFVTITALPPVGPCVNCALASDNYLFSGIGPTTSPKRRTKCMEHSYTFHTSFDIAVPYPEFLPKVNLKCHDFAVFNTNNALHALRVDIDHEDFLPELDVETEEDGGLSVQVPPSPSPPCPAPSRLQEQIIRDFADDASLTPRRIEDNCLSPPLPTRVKTFTPDPEFPHHSAVDHFRRFEDTSPFLTPRVFLRVKRCGLKRLGFRPFFSRRNPSLGIFMDSRKSSPYEFVDDSPNEVEKLSQFRRKRLADKTYEFQDCDSENIVPFSLARHRPASGQTDTDAQLLVLRPLNRNTPPRLLSRTRGFLEKPHLSKLRRPPSPASAPCPGIDEILIHDISGRYSDGALDVEGRILDGLRRMNHCFKGTATRFSRRYHEVDEERVSITTDLEDDDGSAVTGYHTALNLEVHGPGYAQLHMIPSGKASKAGCVRVEQQSLDIEAICQNVATSLCLVAGKTFTFCNDYDVEVLDVCPNTGDVLVLLMMRIEGCEGKKEEGVPVEQFEASVTLVWNLFQGAYRVTMVVPPQKMKWEWDEKCIWNPAREACKRFRAGLPADITWTEPSVRVFSNSSFLRGVSLTKIQDHDNRVQFIL